MSHKHECMLSSPYTRSDNFVPLAVGVVVKLILCLEDYVRTRLGKTRQHQSAEVASAS